MIVLSPLPTIAVNFYFALRNSAMQTARALKVLISLCMLPAQNCVSFRKLNFLQFKDIAVFVFEF